MAYPQELAIAQLVESKNYRKTFLPHQITEIAKSAKALVIINGKEQRRGIVEPLIVRPTRGNAAGTLYEIVCGGKRYRAAKEAELPSVPVRVVDIADGGVLEYQLIENLIRSDPHPMDEAEGFGGLLKVKGYTVEIIAEKVGKDRSYVYKRLQFMELIKPVRLAFLENRINIAHAIQICRLPEHKQPAAFDQCFESSWNGTRHVHNTKGKADIPAKDLARWIREELLHDLASAPWKKDDATLLPKAGPCTTCPKHTGINTALFDDITKGDHCLDGDCFEQKRAAFVLVQIAKAPDLPRITLGYEAPPKGIIARSGNGYELVTPSTKCKFAEPALVAAGEKQLGHAVLICRDRACKTHYRFSSGSAGKTPQQVGAEKQKRLQEKIKTGTQEAALRAIADPEAFDIDAGVLFIGERMLERVGHDNRRVLCAALTLSAPKGKYGGSDFQKPLLEMLRQAKPSRRLPLICAFAACNAYYGRPGYGGGPESSSNLKRAAMASEVDLKKIGAAAAKPILEKFNKAKERAKAKKKPKPKKQTPAETAATKRVQKALDAQAAKS